MPTTLAKSNYMEDGVLNTMRGSALAAWTPYLALSTANPTEDGSGIAEPSGGAYARQAVTMGAPSGGISATSALTIANTPAAGDMCLLRVARLPGDSSDTYGQPARLHGVYLDF